MDKLDFPPFLESMGREFEARILNFRLMNSTLWLSPETRREGGKAAKWGMPHEQERLLTTSPGIISRTLER